MKLAELEPQLLRLEFKRETRRFVQPNGERYDKTDDFEYHLYVDTLAEAQGVQFLCPKCFEQNKGRAGTHGVICWFRDRGVPDAVFPRPGRWAVSGTGLADLTLSPSVLITTGCQWHGFITAGVVTSC